MQDIIRMTYDVALCHPDEITKIWSLSHPDDLAIPSISSGWLIADALCHPDDLPGVGISSGWVTAISLCHPDDLLFHFMSSGWLNWGWFLIRMSYGNVIMSSGWDTLPFLSHPDEIANFDFPHHAVALQRFRSYHPTHPIPILCARSGEAMAPGILLSRGHLPTPQPVGDWWWGRCQGTVPSHPFHSYPLCVRALVNQDHPNSYCL